MTNEEKVLKKFLSQFPDYQEKASELKMNIYCDIMLESDGKTQIIAVSDLPHELMKVGYQLPESWELKKMGRPTDSVKNHDIKVRVDDVTYHKILWYSEENSINIAETIRRAVNEFLKDE